MLKKVLLNSVPWVLALGMTSLLAPAPATGALFEQEDVDQDKFVAIAVPLPQGDRYNLIVLEQKSNEQLCWEETTDQGVINPLLLTFDFSGICGRSTDSNGYSIRQVGEDLALKYRLSLIKKDNALVLMGMPLQSSYGKSFEIGRTRILTDDFLKITLNPDWRLTRRVYQGQPLGHLYFTRDVIPPEPIVEESSVEETVLEAQPESTVAAGASDASDQDMRSPEIEETGRTSRQFNDSLLKDGGGAPQKQNSVEAMPTKPSGPPPLLGPVQIPVPSVPATQSSTQGRNTDIPVSDVSPAPVIPIPVPNIAPLGKVGASEPDVFSDGDRPQLPTLNAAGDPPPPPFTVALSIKRYRVYVDPVNETQTQAAKTIAPDAFWTAHQGRRLLQVGAFFKKSKADAMMQELGQQGISGIIDASQY